MNLRDWYFCTSLRLSAKEIRDFLTLLAFLDGISDRPGIQAEALKQLASLDAPRRLWAFPRVVALLRGAHQEQALFEHGSTYLSQLMRIIPDEVEGAFQQLFRRLTGGATDDLVRSVIYCAERCEQLGMRQPSTTPYLDTETFAPEVIVLSVWAWLAEQRRSVLAKSPDQGANKQTSPIDRLVESALDLQFGRLAHAIATNFAVYFPQDWPKERLFAGLHAESSYQPDLEPDALWLVALIEFGAPRRDTDAGGHKMVVTEILRFEALQRLRRLIRHPAVARQRELMSYLGLENTPDLASTIGLVLWHATLWEWLVERDPQAAAGALEPLWQPRLNDYHSLNVFDRPDAYDRPGPRNKPRRSPQALSLWHDDLKRFASLISDWDLPVLTHIGNKLVFERSDQWMLFSPWLHSTSGTHRGHKAPGRGYQRRYPNEQDWRALLRLICASLISTRILTRVSERPRGESFDAFGAFTMHAADVLSIYRQPSERETDQDRPPIAEPLEGLACAAQRILTLVGCGVHSQVGPERFINIVDHPLPRYVNASDRIRDAYRALFDLCLPEVLVLWLQDAAEMGIDDRRSGRWEQYVSEVSDILYPQGVRRGDRNPAIRLLHELMRRYLGHGSGRPQIEDQLLNWRNPPPKWELTNLWNQNHRRFLIGTEPKLRELGEGPDDVESSDFPSRHFVWSILGVHAASTDRRSDATELTERIDRLERVLHGISDKKTEMDRYIRLRMIELLELLPVQAHPRLPGLIFSLVAEFGSALDLVRVRDILEQATSDTVSWIDTDTLGVLTLTRLLSEDSSYSQTTEDPDAWQALADRDRLAVAEDLLLWILHRESRVVGESRVVRDAVAELRTKLLGRHAALERQVLAADNILDDSGNEHIEVDRPLPLDTAALTAATRDRNSARIWLYVQSPDTFGQVHDLFSLSDDDRERWENQEWIAQQGLNHCRVLALVLPPQLEWERDRVRMRWHIGLRHPIQQSFGRGEEPPHMEGSLVVCPIFLSRDQRSGSHHWRFDQQADQLDITRQHLRALPEGIQLQIRIAPHRPEIGARQDWTFSLGDATFDAACVPLPDWQPDISASFHEPQGAPVWCQAVVNKNGTLRPIYRTFLDLVLEQFPGGSQSLPIVLTLVEFDSDANMEVGNLLLSASIGYYYRIEISRFNTADLEQFSKLRGRLSTDYRSDLDLKGLLISLCLNDDGNGLRLAYDSIGDSGSADAVDRPFDTRNIRWRELFSDNPFRVVESQYHDWFLLLDSDERVPGFDTKIKIQPMSNTPQPFREKMASVLVQGWDDVCQRKATVRAEFVKMEALRAADGDIDALLTRIGEYRPGTRVKLTKKIGEVTEFGYQRCATDENLPVEVTTESLTMEPINVDGLRIGRGGREAEIVSISHRIAHGKVPQIDPETLPEEIARSGACDGVIISVPVPKYREAAGECEVCWKGHQGYVRRRVPIENLSKLGWVQPGMRLLGKQSGGIWTFRLETLIVRARALWLVQQGKTLSTEQGVFLGRQGDTDQALLEYGEGYVRKVLMDKEAPAHLRGSEIRGFSEGLATGANADDRAGNSIPFVPYQQSRPVRRCCLVIEDRTNGDQTGGGSVIIAGHCDPDVAGGAVYIEDIRVTLRMVDQHFADLERTFKLGSVLSREKAAHRHRQGTQEDWDSWIRGNLDQPLDGSIDKDKCCFRLSTSYGIRGVVDLLIPSDEGAFLPHVSYPPDGKAVIYEVAESECAASLRRVTPDRIDEIYTQFGAITDKLVSLRDIQVLYAGPETRCLFKDQEYLEPHHRFEHGFGRTWLIPESKLRYRGQSFTRANLMLFVGDRITQVQFQFCRKANDVRSGPETSSEENGLFLSIENIEISQGHRLFSQAEKGVIHILHLIRDRSHAQITHVEGFNETRADATRASFREVPAVLSPSDCKVLAARLDTDGNDDSKSIILGRLDRDYFIETLGATLQYDHVRLSFDTKGPGKPLENKDQVLLQGGRIIRRTNEVELELTPLDDLNDEDIGADFRALDENGRGRTIIRMQRRNFSVREDLLPRLEAFDSTCLKGSYLYVRVVQRDDRTIETSLRPALTRHVTALTALLHLSEGRVFAAYAETMEGKYLLELRPGALVKLDDEEISFKENNLTAGAIVQVQFAADGQRFEIHRVIFSDMRYVCTSQRPVVVLPKNFMAKAEKAQTAANNPGARWWGKSFSIGDLPDVEAGLGGAGYWPLNRDMSRFMSIQHPKIGSLSVEIAASGKTSLPSVEPGLPPDWLAVRLRINEQQRIAIPDDVTGSRSFGDSIPWECLSFEDGSIHSITTRMRQITWRYHDERTWQWIDQQGHVTVAGMDLASHSVDTGPLFVRHERGNPVTFRYSHDDLVMIGLPVRTLIEFLRSQRHTNEESERDAAPITLPVAAYTGERSIWVEMAPGRLVELPLRLCVHRLDHQAHTLGDVWTGLFAPGDLVDVQLARSRDLFAPDRVTLRWRPGPRGAFGHGRCFLPRIGIDENEGVATYGAGRYRLRRPSSNPSTMPDRVYLLPDNRLVPVEEQVEPGRIGLCRDDVVLLGTDTKGRIVVHGATDIRAYPDRHYNWADDPLHEIFLIPGDGSGARENIAQIRQLIKAAGGALSVTVEYFDEQRQILYYSRKKQVYASRLPRGLVCPAIAQGMLGEKQDVLVRLGGGLAVLPKGLALPGIPGPYMYVALCILREGDEPIWIRGGNNDAFEPPWGHPGTEFVVEPLAAISGDDNSFAGVLCRSVRHATLHWLPAAQAAWYPLDMPDAKNIFGVGGRPFTVRRLSNGEVSATAVNVVAAHLEELKLGASLTVEVLGCKCDDPRLHYVCVRETRILLGCLVNSDQTYPTGSEIRVEITEIARAGRTLVLATPPRERRFHLDLPRSMLASDSVAFRPRPIHAWRLACLQGESKREPADSGQGQWYAWERALYLGIAHSNGDQTQAWIAANAWWQEMVRRPRQPEYDLVPALASLLITLRISTDDTCELDLAHLAKHGGTRAHVQNYSQTRAEEMMCNLGRCALRSLHVEALQRAFSNLDMVLPAEPAFTERVRRLRKQATLDMERDAMRELANYAVKTPLRTADTDTLNAANAVVAATGHPCDAEILVRSAVVLQRLIQICRPFMLPQDLNREVRCAWPSWEWVKGEIEQLLWRVRDEKLDITLLSPLPKIEVHTEIAEALTQSPRFA